MNGGPAPDETSATGLGGALASTAGAAARGSISTTSSPPAKPPPRTPGHESGESLAAASPAPASPFVAGPAGQLGITLEPALRQACDGRLSPITWFRTDWQRGGAVTGYATFRGAEGVTHPVVVKLPVPPRERRWLALLQAHDIIVPRLYAHGETLGGYDLAWVVMERLAHGPLGSAWGGAEFDLLVEAAGRFYAASADVEPTGEAHRPDWTQLCDRARKAVHSGSVPEQQRWNRALKKAHRKHKAWARQWDERPCDDWCHGDLHLGNAMTRHAPPRGPALLFDFAHTRVGHWLEDAIYLEHLFWGRPERLEGRRLARQMARERKSLGLDVAADWPQLAQTKRALLAMTVPARLAHDGDRAHLGASLAVLEAAVG
ncbi:MAG: aminoglycoside phosphotransferase family protein [Phycisphaeraceae bacterium]